MVKDSFHTGLANMAVFFKKNARHIQELRGSGSGEGVHSSGAQTREKSSDPRASIQLFYASFIRVHGLLFSSAAPASRAAEDEVSPMGNASRASAIPSPNKKPTDDDDTRSLSEFAEMTTEVLEALTRLVVNNLLGENTLLRLMIICLCSVQRCVYGSVSVSSSSLEGAAQPTAAVRSTSASLALTLLFSIVNRIALLAETYRKLTHTLLPSLVAYLEWAGANRDCLRQCPVPSPSSSSFTSSLSSSAGDSRKKHGREGQAAATATASNRVVVTWSGPASGDAVAAENRARSGMRTSLTALADALDTHLSASSARAPGSRQQQLQLQQHAEGTRKAEAEAALKEVLATAPLREFVELRGFLPVAERMESYFVSFPDPRAISELDPGRARQARTLILRHFVDKVMLSVPPAPVAAAVGPSLVSSSSAEPRRERNRTNRPPRETATRRGGRREQLQKEEEEEYKRGSTTESSRENKSSRVDRGAARPTAPEDSTRDGNNSGIGGGSSKRRQTVSDARDSRRRSAAESDEEEHHHRHLEQQQDDEDEEEEEETSSYSSEGEDEKEQLQQQSRVNIDTLTAEVGASGGMEVEDERHGGTGERVVAGGGSHKGEAQNYEEDDEDDEDEVIVFKPAFSRKLDGFSSAASSRAAASHRPVADSSYDMDLDMSSTEEAMLRGGGPGLNSSAAATWSVFGFEQQQGQQRASAENNSPIGRGGDDLFHEWSGTSSASRLGSAALFGSTASLAGLEDSSPNRASIGGHPSLWEGLGNAVEDSIRFLADPEDIEDVTPHSHLMSSAADSSDLSQDEGAVLSMLPPWMSSSGAASATSSSVGAPIWGRPYDLPPAATDKQPAVWGASSAPSATQTHRKAGNPPPGFEALPTPAEVSWGRRMS